MSEVPGSPKVHASPLRCRVFGCALKRSAFMKPAECRRCHVNQYSPHYQVSLFARVRAKRGRV